MLCLRIASRGCHKIYICSGYSHLWPALGSKDLDGGYLSTGIQRLGTERSAGTIGGVEYGLDTGATGTVQCKSVSQQKVPLRGQRQGDLSESGASLM